MKRLLYYGDLTKSANAFKRLNTFKKLNAFEIRTIDSKPLFNGFNYLYQKMAYWVGAGPIVNKNGSVLLSEAKNFKPDFIWVDKGLYISPSVLSAIKKATNAVIIHFNPDDAFGKYENGFGLFKKAIPFYDAHFVSRPQNIDEYKQRGAKLVFEFDKSYDPTTHRRIELTPDEQIKFGAKVGFIGTWAKARGQSVYHLVKNGIDVAIYGDAWHRDPNYAQLKHLHRSNSIYGDDYAKAISGMQIALHFLRKENRDFQDSRSFELPACGAFMLAERTYKHEESFTENVEAAYFDDDNDLLEKVKYYIDKPELCRQIGEAAYRRSVASGYDHENRIRQLFKLICNQLNIDNPLA